MKSIEKKLLNLEAVVISSLLLLFCLTGAFMNITVITTNDGKMPFHQDINYSSQSHFSYQNFDEIRYPYISDILRIGDNFFSVGDLIMSLSFILLLVNIGVYRYKIR